MRAKTRRKRCGVGAAHGRIREEAANLRPPAGHSSSGHSVWVERSMAPSSQSKLAGVRVLELFGPSSGGKSSLAEKLMRCAGAPVFVLAQDRLLQRAGLAWLPASLLRKLALDLLVLLVVFLTWRMARAYYVFSAQQAIGGGFPASLWLRLNLLRNAWKGVAFTLIAPRLARPGEIVLLDEGPLQTANYLLVHARSAPSARALDAFLRLVPLPDAAVYVRLDEDELVRRTERRGHPRVPQGVPEASRGFVRHALEVFDRIAAEPRIRRRLLRCEALEQRAAS